MAEMTIKDLMKEIQQLVVNQNLNTQIYGGHSMERRCCQLVLNTKLETLKEINYIDDYAFRFDKHEDYIIDKVIIYKSETLRINITEQEIVYI